MKKRHTEEQIIAILQEADSGVKISELCRKHGITSATYYKWKSKFGGMDVSDAKRLRGIEDENRRLKGLVARLMLENEAMQDVLQKKF